VEVIDVRKRFSPENFNALTIMTLNLFNRSRDGITGMDIFMLPKPILVALDVEISFKLRPK
jgi:hypothetical protein